MTPAVHDCAFAPDDTVRVDVMLNAVGDPIDDGACEVSFDPAVLTFVSAARGALVTSWFTFDVTPLASSVVIFASGAVATPAHVSGAFVRLTFVTGCCGGLQLQNSLLCVATKPGDLAGFGSECGNFRCIPAQPGSISVAAVYQTCATVSGDTVDVDVRLENTPQPVDAAGFDVTYDPARLDYAGFRRGGLTSEWLFFDVAELAGRVRVGGFTLTPIPGGSSGTFVTLRFVASCCGGPGAGTPLCVQSAIDDVATLLPGCGEVICVPLKTHAATWGYVKSLYR